MTAKRLVLVVHGVGDPAPGETVQQFGRALAVESGQELGPTPEVLWLPEESGREVSAFPCHVERIRSSSGETVLGEVHWADIGHAGSGALGAVRGFFGAVFGLRHLARHAADPRRPSGAVDWPARWLQWLSAQIAYVLRGPVTATNGLLAVMLLVTASILTLLPSLRGEGPAGRINEPLASGLVMAIGLLAVTIGLVLYRKRRGRAGGPLALWTGICGLLYALLPLWPYWLSSRVEFVEKYFDLRVPELLGRPVGTGLSIDLSSYGVLIIDFIGLAWVSACVAMVMAWFVWIVALVRAPRRYRPGLNAALVVNTLTVGLWFLAIPAFWVVVNHQLPPEARLESADKMLNQGLRSMGFNWSIAFVLCLVALGSVLPRARWARTATAESYRADKPAPRLLIGRSIEIALILASFASLAGMLLLMVATNREFMAGGAPAWAKPLMWWFDRSNEIAFQVAVVIGAIALALLPHLRVGLDIGLDVINHFRREPSSTEAVRRLSRRSGEHGGPATGFVRRERIRRRVRAVLKTLVIRERPASLTLLAHSQGTIAAIEVLAEGLPEELAETIGECSLVTMGSPFSHLYQHYFPNDYPDLADARWAELRSLVGTRWVNIFRVDDFVGTDIEPAAGWPRNHPVDPGGHTGYWTDRQVLESLVGEGSAVRLLG